MIYKNGVGHNRLEDLIAGVTPTYSSWTVDPTDGADITDGDISTFCTTGNRVTGAGWQYSYLSWDLGAFYNIAMSMAGSVAATAGTPFIYMYFYDGANWKRSLLDVAGASFHVSDMYAAACSMVRLGLTSSAASTITPNIREAHAWRL